ncbi:hypothetical protein KFE26_07840 [Shewanella sp. M16]|uniref:hypothetical protein n=1 Tax=Shewanella sp. M16 TaxID=2830837 RepID=UPI001BAFFA23|nr:hypothetical protein [Shewanella sp. M16]MBS0042216.1 hypothetical protein [Shewanella sp. M16]
MEPIETDIQDNNFIKWSSWLKYAAIIGIAIFIVVMVWYFFQFSPLMSDRNIISEVPDDWGAFGSLLGGASSFLAAIGTVGVMLLGIQQFIIQQKQIEKQNNQIEKQTKLIEKQENRQEALEKKQSEIWDVQRKLLIQEESKLILDYFTKSLDSVEAENKNHSFNNKFLLHKKINTALNITEFTSKLVQHINNFNSKLEKVSETEPLVIGLHDLKSKLIIITSHLGIVFCGNKKSGDLCYLKDRIGFNIYMIESSINSLNSVIESLSAHLLLSDVNIPPINSQFKLRHNDCVNLIVKNKNYSDLSMISTFEGSDFLFEFYTYAKFVPSLFNGLKKYLYDLEVSMFGVEDFNNEEYRKKFIKDATCIIKAVENNQMRSEIKSKFDSAVQSFNQFKACK